MSLRFHEIAEAHHRQLNPFDDDKLILLGEICKLHSGMRVLDLCCGKGELLCRWAQSYGIHGVGVDFSEVFIKSARARAAELNVLSQVNFVVDDPQHYPAEHHEYDIVACAGSSWIGNGFVGTLELMKVAIKEGGLMLIGEPFWYEEPPVEALDALAIGGDVFATLGGTLDRLENAGFELIEMVLADQDHWDRYEASQWMAVDEYLTDHPDDPDADDLRRWMSMNRRVYLQYGRRYMGWGVFLLRIAAG